MIFITSRIAHRIALFSDFFVGSLEVLTIVSSFCIVSLDFREVRDPVVLPESDIYRVESKVHSLLPRKTDYFLWIFAICQEKHTQTSAFIGQVAFDSIRQKCRYAHKKK